MKPFVDLERMSKWSVGKQNWFWVMIISLCMSGGAGVAVLIGAKFAFVVYFVIALLIFLCMLVTAPKMPWNKNKLAPNR